MRDRETKIAIARANLKVWEAELKQKRLFLDVFKASGNKIGMNMASDHILDLEGRVRMMKEALKHLEPTKSTRKKRGRKC